MFNLFPFQIFVPQPFGCLLHCRLCQLLSPVNKPASFDTAGSIMQHKRFFRVTYALGIFATRIYLNRLDPVDCFGFFVTSNAFEHVASIDMQTAHIGSALRAFPSSSIYFLISCSLMDMFARSPFCVIPDTGIPHASRKTNEHCPFSLSLLILLALYSLYWALYR